MHPGCNSPSGNCSGCRHSRHRGRPVRAGKPARCRRCRPPARCSHLRFPDSSCKPCPPGHSQRPRCSCRPRRCNNRLGTPPRCNRCKRRHRTSGHSDRSCRYHRPAHRQSRCRRPGRCRCRHSNLPGTSSMCRCISRHCTPGRSGTRAQRRTRNPRRQHSRWRPSRNPRTSRPILRRPPGSSGSRRSGRADSSRRGRTLNCTRTRP